MTNSEHSEDQKQSNLYSIYWRIVSNGLDRISEELENGLLTTGEADRARFWLVQKEAPDAAYAVINDERNQKSIEFCRHLVSITCEGVDITYNDMMFPPEDDSAP